MSTNHPQMQISFKQWIQNACKTKTKLDAVDETNTPDSGVIQAGQLACLKAHNKKRALHKNTPPMKVHFSQNSFFIQFFCSYVKSYAKKPKILLLIWQGEMQYGKKYRNKTFIRF